MTCVITEKCLGESPTDRPGFPQGGGVEGPPQSNPPSLKLRKTNQSTATTKHGSIRAHEDAQILR